MEAAKKTPVSKMYCKAFHHLIKAELVMMAIVSVLGLLIENSKTLQVVQYFLKTFTLLTRTLLCSYCYDIAGRTLGTFFSVLQPCD